MSKVIPNDTKKVEIVEIQDEKQTNEINGSEFKSKSDTRWSDNKSSIKKESIDTDRKYDSKSSIKKEPIENDKEKK